MDAADGITLEGTQVMGSVEGEDTPDGAGLTTAAAAALASGVVAASLVGALSEPPRADLITLPEPTPIVQTYQVEEDAVPAEDKLDDVRTERWRRILRALRYLLLALALVATVLFGVLRGCAGAVGGVLPSDEDQQPTTTHAQPTEDERGVAY